MKNVGKLGLLFLCVATKILCMQPVQTQEEPEVFIMRSPSERVSSHFLRPGMRMENRQMYERYKKAYAQWQANGRVGPEPQLVWVD